MIAISSPVDFGEVQVGTERREFLTWKNDTGQVVHVNGVDPVVSAGGVFRYVEAHAIGPHGSASGDVKSGSKATITAGFTPNRLGSHSEAFVLLVDMPHTCEVVVAQGWGIGYVEQGAFQLEELFYKISGLLDCGVVPIGEVGTATFDLQNNSGSDVAVTTAWESGQYFILSVPLHSIPAGVTWAGGFFNLFGAERISVFFSPQFEGEALDVLTIQDASGADNRFSIAVKGIGVTYGDHGALCAPAAADELDFGDVVVGSSRWVAFYVTNSSDEKVYFKARIISGTQAFFIDAPQPAAGLIPAGDQLGFVIRFTPPAPGDYLDALVIADSRGRHVVARRLRGRGVAPLSAGSVTSPGW